MESNFADLPDQLLRSCLCLTSFATKLHCELVCKSWRSVLQRPAVPDGENRFVSLPGVWGRVLLLTISAADKKRARTHVEKLHREDTHTAIHIVTTSGPLSSHDEACLSWIARRAMTVNLVSLRSKSSLSGQLLPHLATALEAARALAPAGWQIELDAGELARITSSSFLLSGCLSRFVVCVMQCCLMCACLAGFDITQAQLGCKKLAGLLTAWETDTVQQLACLTQLTYLCCKVGPHRGSWQDLLQLSLLQSLNLRFDAYNHSSNLCAIAKVGFTRSS